MPVVRISEQTWERLKKWAVPLEDTAEDVINKILEIAERRGESNQEPPAGASGPSAVAASARRRGKKTPQEAFKLPICRILFEQGGRAPARTVLDLMPEMMKETLTDFDFLEVPSGGQRWHKSANWARYVLAAQGYLRSDSERGYWELSDKGKRWIETQI